MTQTKPRQFLLCPLPSSFSFHSIPFPSPLPYPTHLSSRPPSPPTTPFLLLFTPELIFPLHFLSSLSSVFLLLLFFIPLIFLFILLLLFGLLLFLLLFSSFSILLLALVSSPPFFRPTLGKKRFQLIPAMYLELAPSIF